MQEAQSWFAKLPVWAKWGLGIAVIGGLAYLAYRLYQSYSLGASSTLPSLGSETSGTPLSIAPAPSGSGSGASTVDYASQLGTLAANQQQTNNELSSLLSAVQTLGPASVRSVSPSSPMPTSVTQEPSGATAQETVANVGSYNGQATTVASVNGQPKTITFNGVAMPAANAGPFPATKGGLVLGSGPAAMAESQALALQNLPQGA